MLRHVRHGYYRYIHVISGYVMLGLFILVRTGYDKLGQVGPGLVMLSHFIPGYIRLSQVRCC
jgi:hypothetical protein